MTPALAAATASGKFASWVPVGTITMIFTAEPEGPLGASPALSLSSLPQADTASPIASSPEARAAVLVLRM